ncbi:ABC transporter permease [Pelagibius litoralis]|uniref:ABC transporter permease n=1 Tax=Pelagibius litoralis TaxID=374515 RepID=A0A967F196_9PROT|nr:ABC transporter permease [Pelagibius litoralis]NIA71313.1 ABC transporter permease [Pelagibius litoralis]
MTTTTRAQRIRRRTILGLTPAVTMMGAFMVIPLILVVVMSFMTRGQYGGIVWEFSTDAYQRLIYVTRLDGSLAYNLSFLAILSRSLVLAGLTTLICLLIAFPTAFYVARQSQRTKSILLLLIMFPFWSNLLVRTTSWIIILRDFGFVNQFLMWVGITSEPITLLFTNGAILVGLVYVYIPFMILPIYTSVERLDNGLLEASFDLFATRFQTVRHVIGPLTMPGIIAGSILVFVPSLGAFITPDLLGGGKKLMLGSLIHLQFTTARNWPYGASLSVLLLAAVLIAMFILARRAIRARG